MNKAQLQIQFNWIFVIIIGSVFLLFFFGIINQQSKTTDERISISQSKLFETVITATGQKVGTLKEYSLPGLDVKFECDVASNSYGYYVENLPARDTKYDVMFTRNHLVGNDIQTWTQIWEVPFKAATFLYITNSKQGYIFYNYSAFNSNSLGASNDFEDLYDDFPKNISVELIDSKDKQTGKTTFVDVMGRNYESNTYVFLYGEEFRKPLGLFKKEDYFNVNKDNKIIVLRKGEHAQELFDYGRAYYFSVDEFITFISKLPSSPSLTDEDELAAAYDARPATSYASYLGKASLYGTIFSENKNVYECNMNKAFSRLHIVTQLYATRTAFFTDDDNAYELSIDCREALGFYDAVGDAAYFPQQQLNYLSSDVLTQGYSNERIELVYDKLFALNDNNKYISRLAGCPAIY